MLHVGDVADGMITVRAVAGDIVNEIGGHEKAIKTATPTA